MAEIAPKHGSKPVHPSVGKKTDAICGHISVNIWKSYVHFRKH